MPAPFSPRTDGKSRTVTSRSKKPIPQESKQGACMGSSNAKLTRNTMPVFVRRIFFLIIFSAFSVFHSVPAFAQNVPTASPISADSDKLLHRMFASTDFEVKNFGPARWLDGGDFYTTVERSPDTNDAQEIERYERATEKRKVFLSPAKMIPR